jgi:hypothetical protein
MNADRIEMTKHLEEAKRKEKEAAWVVVWLALIFWSVVWSVGRVWGVW